MRADAIATEKAGLRKGSYVDMQGRHVLKNRKDMEARRREVFERANGLCEGGSYSGMMRFSLCGRRIYWETFHLHHVIKRSAGRDDRATNLLALCPECHLSLHNQRHLSRSDERGQA